MGYIEDYAAQCARLIAELDAQAIEQIADALYRCFRAGGCIFAMGNGGSGATASHLVNDINKAVCANTPRPKAIALTDNMPWFSALANDIGYHAVFEEQLKNFLQPDDAVVGISGSGNSENVLRAVRYAKQVGAPTVALVGFDGGKLKGLADICLHVPCHDMGMVEGIHSVVCHIIPLAMRRRAEEDGLG